MKVTCPSCGEEKQFAAGKVPQKYRCKECDKTFSPAMHKQAKDKDTAAWYRNTPVVVALGFAIVVVMFLGGYLAYDSSRSQFRAQIEELKSEGHKFQEANRLANAVERYEEVISKAEASSDPAVQRSVADAKIQKDKAAANLKAEIERAELQRKKEQAETQDREMARLAADEKAKRDRAQEAEQKRQAETQRQKEEDEKLLAQAVVLQAPTKPAPLDEFAVEMRSLAENEFEFADAKGRLFRSTFDANFKFATNVNLGYGRNVIVSSGKYAFDKGSYDLILYPWFQFHGKSSVVPIDTDDYCGLVTTFKLDEATARKWRQAIDQKNFRLTIWYRLKRVAEGSWKRNPHFTDGTIAHKILFEVEVVKAQFVTE